MFLMILKVILNAHLWTFVTCSSEINSLEYFKVHPTGFSTELGENSEAKFQSEELWKSVEELYPDPYEYSANDSPMPPPPEIDDLRVLGVTENRRYFISSKKKVWSEADKFCVENKAELYQNSCNHEENKKLWKMLHKFVLSMNMDPNVAFWFNATKKEKPHGSQYTDPKTLVSSECKKFSIKQESSELKFISDKGDCFEFQYFICFEQFTKDDCDNKEDYGAALQARNDEDIRKCVFPPDNSNIERMFPNSKYFYDKHRTNRSWEESRQFCEENNLELMEITNDAERSLITKYLRNSITYYVYVRDHIPGYWLGLNDRDDPGYYTESDGFTPIQYQLFYFGHPKRDEHCVKINMEPTLNILFESEDCDKKTAATICQFPKSSPCHYQSPERMELFSYANPIDIMGENEEDALYFMQRINDGTGSIISFYVGSKQKTWEEADTACKSQNMNLAQLKYDVTYMSELSVYLQRHDMTENININSWEQFWSEQLVNNDPSRHPEYIPQGIVVPEWKKTYWSWFDNEPQDNTGNGLENCVSYMLRRTFDVFITTDYEAFAANCLIPKRYVCVLRSMQNGQPLIPWSSINKTIILELEEKNYCRPKYLDPSMLDFQALTLEQTIGLGNSLHHAISRRDENRMEKTRTLLFTRLLQIFKRSCPVEFVPSSFVYMLSDLFRNYWALWAARNPDVTFSTNWDSYVNELEFCMETVGRLKITGEGYRARYLHSDDGERIKISVKREDVDFVDLDKAVDALWHIFSFSVASCYSKIDSDHPMWFARYFHNFDVDFLQPMYNQWRYPGSKKNLGFIMGDHGYSHETILYNIRACTAAAYLTYEIPDRLLARPLHKRNETSFLDDLVNTKSNDDIL